MTQEDEDRLKLVHPDLMDRYLRGVEYFKVTHGFDLRPTETLRNESKQLQYFKVGRLLDIETGKWKVVGKTITNALPSQSWHVYGLAIDSCFEGQDPYLEHMPKNESDTLWTFVGESFEREGLTWGGRFKGVDRPHCEMKYGLSLKDTEELYAKGGVMAVWDKVDVILTCGGHIT